MANPHLTLSRPTNAFVDLENHLHSLDACGHRLAEATAALRVSATIIAAAARRASSRGAGRAARRALRVVRG
jgi:hypothetical protein